MEHFFLNIFISKLIKYKLFIILFKYILLFLSMITTNKNDVFENSELGKGRNWLTDIFFQENLQVFIGFNNQFEISLTVLPRGVKMHHILNIISLNILEVLYLPKI